MEKLWKCDFCTFTHTDKFNESAAVVAKHERSCRYNPVNKLSIAITPDMSKIKAACHTCGYYTGKGSKKKCFTSQCPMFVRPKPRKRKGSGGMGMGDGTTLGIGGVKT